MNIAGVNILPPENMGVVAESMLKGDAGFWYGVLELTIASASAKKESMKERLVRLGETCDGYVVWKLPYPSCSHRVLHSRYWKRLPCIQEQLEVQLQCIGY